MSPYVSMALTSTQFVITEAALAGYQGIFEDTGWCWRRAAGSAVSSARPARRYRRANGSSRAAAVRCEATSSSRSDRSIAGTILSAGAH